MTDIHLTGLEPKTLGQAIRTVRNEKQMSIYQVASKAEITTSHLADIENGRTEPTLRVLHDVAQAMGRTISIGLHEEAKESA